METMKFQIVIKTIFVFSVAVEKRKIWSLALCLSDIDHLLHVTLLIKYAIKNLISSHSCLG